MEVPFLFALAVGPGILLLHAIYVADRYEREPVRNMLRYVFAGALICVPAGVGEIVIIKIARADIFGGDPVNPVLFICLVFLGIAFIEEGSKRWVLRHCARNDQNLDEPFDWIVYSVSVALGFAMLENIIYVYNGGFVTGVLRAFTAVPEHALCGTFMGVHLARAAILMDGEVNEVNDANIRRERILAIVEPALWHGVYDALALGSNRAAIANNNSLAVFLGAGLVAMITAQWILAFIRVRAHQKHALLGNRVPPILLSRRMLGRPGVLDGTDGGQL